MRKNVKELDFTAYNKLWFINNIYTLCLFVIIIGLSLLFSVLPSIDNKSLHLLCLQKKVELEVKCYNSHKNENSSNKSYEIIPEIKVRSNWHEEPFSECKSKQ